MSKEHRTGKKANPPRSNSNISMNPNNALLMKNRMRLSDNLMNPVPGSFYKNKNESVNM